MPPCTGGYRDQSIRACSSSFPAERNRHNIGQHDPAIFMDHRNGRCGAAQSGNHDRRLVLGYQRKIVGQPVVGAMGDKIGRPDSSTIFRFGNNLRHPLVKLLRCPAIGCGKGSDQSGTGSGNDHLRPGNQKHRSNGHRQAQAFENRIHHDSLSTIIATPTPCAPDATTSPYLPLAASRASSKVDNKIAPVAPIGWPLAI